MSRNDVQQNDAWMPWCTRCNRPVESVEWETPLHTVVASSYVVMSLPTGEVILTVRCHGEAWTASNWRGEL